MSSAKQNKSIAKLIVGAMTIDGSLDKKERQKVAHTLDVIGFGELIADVGAAIDEEDGSFNMFDECKAVMESLGSEAAEVAPLIYRVVCDVIAHDRFVSVREASYIAGMGKRLGLTPEMAQGIFKQVMAERRGRLEVAGKDIDEAINANLKNLLSFQGADDLVGEVEADALEELMHSMEEGANVSRDEFSRAMAMLGLKSNAKVEDAEAVWKETIDNLNLPKMADLGETFVTAAIGRISKINEAYKTILHFHSQAISQRYDDEEEGES